MSVTSPTASLLYALSQDVDTAWDESILEYKHYKNDLSVVNEVVLFRGKVVVTIVLRPEVLGALHLAHQGTTGMLLRAQD